jgi:hypothetical protein
MTSEYHLMIYKRPGFLAVAWFVSSPTPLSLSKFCLSLSAFLRVAGQAYWREGGGAKSYDGEKAWSFINHSKLTDTIPLNTVFRLPSYWNKILWVMSKPNIALFLRINNFNHCWPSIIVFYLPKTQYCTHVPEYIYIASDLYICERVYNWIKLSF